MNSEQEISIRVCLVEDNVMERASFEDWISQDNSIESIGSFDDLESALPVIQSEKPDVVILDYALPGIKGGEAVATIKSALPSTRVMVVTGVPDDYVVFDALEAGADGFADKAGLTASEFLKRIRDTHAGEAPLSLRARNLVLKKLQADRPQPLLWGELTEREKEVVRLLKKALPDKEIAAELKISGHGVHFHLREIYSKLDAHDRYQVLVKLWGGGG